MWGPVSQSEARRRGFAGHASINVLAIAISFATAPETSAQQLAPVPPTRLAATTIPEIVVSGRKPTRRTKPRRHAAAPAPAPAAAPATTAPATGSGGGSQAPLEQVPAGDKTGTRIADLPQSVVVLPREQIVEQGGTSLRDAIHQVSGINEGGASSYGFFDRFTIRGLDARIYSDGFPDGDQSNGFPHSINGVQTIEVLKGPGSALFGSGPPGGTINIVHFMPSAVPGYGIGVQLGSFSSWTTSVYATGPTLLPGVTYRIDGLLQHSAGFRDLESANYEVRPFVAWNHDNHTTIFALDVRHIERTPDSYGIVYFNGAAEAGTPAAVPNTFRYSTPFSYGNQDFGRATLTDAWWVGDFLTVNNRSSLLYRDVDILRNSGGGTIAPVGGLFQLQARQLREQTDHDTDFTYQFEPVWKFYTGSIFHTLVTGAQVEWQAIDDNRATADLPNISNIFAPVIPETSASSLTFLRDAKHSGMIDDLRALYLSAYATDQMDVTDRWKVRLGVRQDHWWEGLTPQVFVPGRLDLNGNLFLPGVTESRVDTPFSWSAGTLYKILPGLAPFVGVSKSYLTNFNSESTSAGLAPPESGLEYEGGLKISTPDGRFSLTAAAFKILRANVFTENTATIPIQVAFNAQESRGVDADLQVQVTPQWKILANAIAQKAVLTAVPLTPTQVGNWPVGVPARIFNLWTTYDFAIGSIQGFKVGGGLSYNSASYGSTANTTWIPASTVIDTMVAYSSTHWNVQFGIKNIANVTYYTIAQSAGGYVGLPRTYYVKADWHY
jgi:iron complex outermembrane recepter protein